MLFNQEVTQLRVVATPRLMAVALGVAAALLLVACKSAPVDEAPAAAPAPGVSHRCWPFCLAQPCPSIF